MVIEGRYLDEVLRALYGALANSTDSFSAGKGTGQDLLAPKVVLKVPRARISATATRGRLISALGEFCWYMSGSSDLDFIRHYIPKYPPLDDDDNPLDVCGGLRDAYGPRLIGSGQFGFNTNQLERIIERLSRKSDTRRAVISILESADLAHGREEAPCTLALQFIRRRERLHLIAIMRSNDAYLGFPHDVFCFSMIQEIVARALGIGLGEYHHFATSLHLYDRDKDKVSAYLSEGFQNPTFAMPKMPTGDQRENLAKFLGVESQIRSGEICRASEIRLPQYWKDLALVLLRKADSKFRRGTKIKDENFSKISNEFYKTFFDKQPKMIVPDARITTNLQQSFNLDEEKDA